MPSKSQKKRGKATSPKQKASTRSMIPIAVARGETHRRPVMRSSERGMDIAHTEYVSTITVNTTSDPTANGFYVIPSFLGYGGLDVNPGFSQAFPWLSNIARNYERYRFDRLEYRFVAKQPTTASGFLVVMFDYDFMDEVPTTKSSFLMNLSSREASCFKDLILPVDARRLSEGAMNGGWRYVSNEFMSSAGETRETMAGFPVVATDALPVDAVYSWDIWCSYTIKLEVERPPVDTSSEFRCVPADNSLSDGAYHLTPGTTLDATSSNVTYALDNGGDPKLDVKQMFGVGGPVLAPASQPGAGVTSSTVPNWGIFRILKEALGRIDLTLNWDSVGSGSGATTPDILAASNKFELWAWPATGTKLDDYVVKVPKFQPQTGEAVSTQNAFIHTSPSWGDVSRLTHGLNMSFILDQTFYAALHVANCALNQLVFGLVNVGSVAMTQLAVSSAMLGFVAMNPAYHRGVGLASSLGVQDLIHPRYYRRSAPRMIPADLINNGGEDEESNEIAKPLNPGPPKTLCCRGSVAPQRLQGTRL